MTRKMNPATGHDSRRIWKRTNPALVQALVSVREIDDLDRALWARDEWAATIPVVRRDPSIGAAADSAATALIAGDGLSRVIANQRAEVTANAENKWLHDVAASTRNVLAVRRDDALTVGASGVFANLSAQLDIAIDNGDVAAYGEVREAVLLLQHELADRSFRVALDTTKFDALAALVREPLEVDPLLPVGARGWTAFEPTSGRAYRPVLPPFDGTDLEGEVRWLSQNRDRVRVARPAVYAEAIKQLAAAWRLTDRVDAHGSRLVRTRDHLETVTTSFAPVERYLLPFESAEPASTLWAIRGEHAAQVVISGVGLAR